MTIERRPRSAPGATPARATARRTRRPRRLTAFVIAFLFFFGPLGAFVLGQRPVAFENHALAEFPSVSDDGWKFFPEFTTWAVDHLPLRDKAVQANARASELLFREPPSFGAGSSGGPVTGVPSGDTQDEEKKSPYAKVLQGKDGWLYFGADVEELCEPDRSIDETISRINRLAAAVQASGRRFVLTIAPDKSTIVPEKLPDTYYGKDCAADRRAAFWKAIEATPPTGYVDLRADIEAEQERTGTYLYRQTDTHWTSGGAAVYAKDLADALDPHLWGSTQVVDTGTMKRTGDLGPMIGAPHEDQYGAVEIRRPGVTPVGRDSLDLPEMPYSPVTLTNKTTGAALFQPRTLLMGDSFTSASRQALGGLFANLTLLHGQVAKPYPDAVAHRMVDADVVVYEVVERTIAGGDVPLLSDASLDAVEKTLSANPR